ncbi:MAG: hypothetical protein J7577_01025 [Sphingobacteriaceae bacterium]|nr:hypothetical protein [Sphingobacteriaceae bacterium]
MNTKVTKLTDNPNSTLNGLIANLTQMQNDKEWHNAIGVGSASYAEGISTAIEALREYMSISNPIRKSLKLSHGRVNR